MAATTNVQVIIDAKDNASHVLKSFGTNATSVAKGFQADFKGAGIMATAFLGSIVALGAGMMKTASTFEQTRISFETMLGSAEEAKTMMAALAKFTLETPFEMTQVLQGSKSLLAYGIAAGDIIPTFKMLGDIAAGVGMDKLPNLVLAFGQVKAATKLTGMELRQFTEAGVPLLDILSKTMGKTVAEIKDMVTAGEVGFPAVQEALAALTGEGGKFQDLMIKQSKSFAGLMSNIKDKITQTISEIAGVSVASGEVREGSLFAVIKRAAEDLYKAIDIVTPKLIEFSNWFTTNQTALAVVAGVIGGLLVGAIVALIMAFSTAAITLAIFVSIGAMLGLWIKGFIDSVNKAKEGFVLWGNTIKEVGEWIKITWANIGAWASVLKDKVVNKFNEIKNGIVTSAAEIINFVTAIPQAISSAFAVLFGGMGTDFNLGAIEKIFGTDFARVLNDTNIAIINFVDQVKMFFAALPAAIYQFFVVDIPYAIGYGVGMIQKFFTVDVPAAWAVFINFLTVSVPAMALQFVTWFTDMANQAWLAIVNFTTVTVPLAITNLILWLSIQIPALATAFVGWITTMATNAWNAIVKWKNDTIVSVTEAKNSLIAKVIELYNEFVAWIKKLVKDVIDGINSMPERVREAMQRLKEAAVNKAEEIYNGVKGWFDKIVGFFDNIISKAGEAINRSREAFREGVKAGVNRATGGTIPGPIGAPVSAIVHGGEIVTPVGRTGGNSGGEIIFNVSVGLYAGTETEKRNIASDLYSALVQVAQSQNKTVFEYMGG